MHRKSKNIPRLLIVLSCITVLLAGAIYCCFWLINQSQIEERNLSYSQLYIDVNTELSKKPTPEPTPAPTLQLPSIVDQPYTTPDSDTLVFSLPEAPPVQDSFSELLKVNPETIGFLKLGDLISLPVVQRENDNSFYLDHNFEQEPAREGTLFLDGMNRLVPEDDCLIIYGHNMNNGSMFGKLSRYGNAGFLKNHPIASFDTLYENRAYVPFAVFPASMNPDSDRYFDVRQITFDSLEFNHFVNQLKLCSQIKIPVDVQYGDRLLLLVTCNYAQDDGRFIMALRQLRKDETIEDLSMQIAGIQ